MWIHSFGKSLASRSLVLFFQFSLFRFSLSSSGILSALRRLARLLLHERRGTDEVILLQQQLAELPDCFIIVRRDKPELYQHLRESYAGDAWVTVIVDRRATSTAVPPEANERQGERRGGDRRAPAIGDRRQARRRQPLASPQHEVWITEGFVVVRRVTSRRRRFSGFRRRPQSPPRRRPGSSTRAAV